VAMVVAMESDEALVYERAHKKGQRLNSVMLARSQSQAQSA